MNHDSHQSALALFSIVAILAGNAQGSHILVMSSGNAGLDAQTTTTLESFGHVVDLGPQYLSFDGTPSLNDYNAVLLLTNANWNQGDMPAAGQAALLDYVHDGGGLVTSEWLVWKHAAQSVFQHLYDAIPVVSTGTFRSSSTATYSALMADPMVSEGVAKSFSFIADSFSGTETFFAPRPGATAYYDSDYPGGAGLIGWEYGIGRVMSFSTLIGSQQLLDPNYSRLLSNTMTWATTCPADLDADGEVGIQDFLALLAAWGTDPDGPPDFNGDDIVAIDDMTRLIADWGPCP